MTLMDRIFWKSGPQLFKLAVWLVVLGAVIAFILW